MNHFETNNHTFIEQMTYIENSVVTNEAMISATACVLSTTTLHINFPALASNVKP